MSFLEVVRVALGSLVTNRLRALLTTLGIIIGVGSVIALISLGRGVEGYIASEFEGLGSNLLVLFSAPPKSPTRDRIQPISTVEAEDLLALPGIVRMAPIHGLQGNINFEREFVRGVTSYGVTPDYLAIRNYPVLYGRWVDESDLADLTRNMVLGYNVAETLFGADVDATGEIVRYRDTNFTVVGIMDETSSVAGENDVIYMPITTSQQRLAPDFRRRTRDGGYYLDAIYLQAASEDVMDEATRQIEEYMLDAHDIQFEGEQDFTIANQAQILSSLGGITQNLTIFLSLIASTSLLVGGIGIMNIMLVTVTERTKEIGLRKAVGAKQSDILLQFLVESIVLSLLGGFLGIAFGATLAFLGDYFVEQLTLTLDADAVILATGVSVFIGIAFGFYPAWQAARKNPIDAIRFE